MASVEKSNKIQRQDTGIVTTSTKKPLLSLFGHRNESIYTPCYCEENVYKLCEDVARRHPAELTHCYAVFISNDRRTVPLWRQLAGHDEERLVVWDYHVIFAYAPDERCLIYDLDSELPFPTHFHKYVTETFRSDHALRPDYIRYFRVVPATELLTNFSSDRRHMKRPDGTWLKPPPSHPIIQGAGSRISHNLDDYLNMDPTQGPGDVLSLAQLVKRFYHQP